MRRLRLILGVLAISSLLLSGGLARAAGAPSVTGNVLVLLDRPAGASAKAASVQHAVRAVVASLNGHLAGRSVPEIGLLTVRPPAGVSAAAFAATLAAVPGVASATPERRFVPRMIPNDPALHTPDSGSGVVQWALARENLYKAWDISRGDGALVGVIDSGVDATHPDLASKIASAVDEQDPSDARGSASTDEVGHGTHVGSLACAATNNGVGLAGAGYNCRLVVEKTDFTDSSIAAAIVDAANRHVGAINMSFGPSVPSPNSAPASEIRALDYAEAHGVVLVAAAADTPGSEQGDPANVLQPAGTGPNLTQGLGLDVTAADFSGHRASFAGFGSEISLAAYGAFQPDAGGLLGLGGPVPGIFGAFPANATDLEALPEPCGCRTTFGGDDRYAYLQGTSMAAPQVAAVAAMMRVLNPFATVPDVLIALKGTATRPAGAGWTSDLGWGILNADGALEAIRRVDRLAPVSRLRAPRVSRHRVLTLHWSGHDARYGELIPSGIAHIYVYARTGRGPARLIDAAGPAQHTLRFHGRAGAVYAFYTVAVDRSGNRERKPVSASTRVLRGAR